MVGDGSVDLVLVHGWVCTFQPGWEYPKLAAFYRRLASMGRLILFDKRGTGLSDRVSPEHLPDLETRMDDVRAVLDAADSERVVLLGISEGGAMSTLFAATHPERIAALVLMGTFPREMQAPGYAWGVSEENLQRRLSLLEQEDWASAATSDWLGRVAPNIPRDPEALRRYTSYVQRGASPGAARALRLMNTEIDIRDLLATTSVPTLVLHRAHETWRQGSDMGKHIPGARMVELPGDDHLPWEGDAESLLDEIEHFLSGAREKVEPDREPATLLGGRHRRLYPRTHPKSATTSGTTWLFGATGSSAPSSCAFAGAKSTPPGTAWSPPSTAPPAPSAAPRQSSRLVRELGLETRVGVHTGEVEQSTTGVRGIAVDVGARIAGGRRPGRGAVSNTVRDIVAGSGIAFEDRGEHELDEAPGTRRLFAASA